MKKIIMLSSFIIFILTFSLISHAEGLENLYDLNLLNTSTKTYQGVTVNYNGDGSYTLNGVGTGTGSYVFLNPNLLILEPGFYILYSGNVNCSVVVEKNETGTSQSFVSQGNLVFFRVENAVTIKSYILYRLDEEYNDLIVYPSLTKYNVAPNGVKYLYTQADINESFAQGELDGVSEYKTSAEYAAALSDERKFGFEEGYQNGKSDGYSLGAEAGERVGYITGYKSGYENFKLSEKYKRLLQLQFDEGYDEGIASVEEKTTENYIYQYAVPLIVVCGALCIALLIFKSRKRRRYNK